MKKGYCIICSKKLTKRKYKFCNKHKSLEKANANYKDGRTLKKYYCKDCEKIISYDAIRCKSCATKYDWKLKKYKNRNFKSKYSPCWKGGLPKCIDCKEELSRYDAERCKKCDLLYRIGEKNSNWHGGKSFEPYPLGWNKTYKEQIRFRDKYKCQICGCPEVECNRKLCVHHIDYNKKNIKSNNLISLCLECHIKTNYNRKYWEKIFQCKKIKK